VLFSSPTKQCNTLVILRFPSDARTITRVPPKLFVGGRKGGAGIWLLIHFIQDAKRMRQRPGYLFKTPKFLLHFFPLIVRKDKPDRRTRGKMGELPCQVAVKIPQLAHGDDATGALDHRQVLL
jgi:hypothetical protein